MENYSSGDDSDSSSDDDIVELNQFSQMLLQSMQAIGILTAEQMKEIVLAIMRETSGRETADDITSEFIQKKLDAINQAINPLNMAIRKVFCEINETPMYMFFATIESPVMKFQTSFTQFEVELFKNIIKVILGKEDFTAPLEDLVRCSREVKSDNKPRTHSQISKMIEKFIELKYLVGSDGETDQLTLGIRTVREMEALLQDVYKWTIGNCCLCKNLILNGLKCGECNFDFHLHCFKAYIANAAQCPNPVCKANLPNLDNMPKRTGTKPADEENSNMELDDGQNGDNTPSSDSD